MRNIPGAGADWNVTSCFDLLTCPRCLRSHGVSLFGRHFYLVFKREGKLAITIRFANSRIPRGKHGGKLLVLPKVCVPRLETAFRAHQRCVWLFSTAIIRYDCSSIRWLFDRFTRMHDFRRTVSIVHVFGWDVSACCGIERTLWQNYSVVTCERLWTIIDFIFFSACKWRTRWGASRTQPVNPSTLNSASSPESLEPTSAYNIATLLSPSLQNRLVYFISLAVIHAKNVKRQCIIVENELYVP